VPDGNRIGDAINHCSDFNRFIQRRDLPAAFPSLATRQTGDRTFLLKLMPATMAGFAELCERLAQTGSKLQKRALMAEYMQAQPTHEAGLAALYFSGVPFPETDGRELQVGGALLSRVIARLSGANQEQMHSAYRRRGDLGGAAQDLLQVRTVTGTLLLPEVATNFASVAAAGKPAAKEQLTLDLLERATPLEAKYLIKIMLGDMRTGIQVSLVEEAIAAAYNSVIGEVRRARMLNGNLPEVLELAASGRLAEARLKLFHPLGFMLASPVETVEEALQRFGPLIQEAQFEDKYDGVRAQVHCGSPDHPGRVALFSRSREDMTVSFPEIVEAFAGVDEPLVLDGEILAWSRAEGRALPFSSLQARLGRKRVTTEMRTSVPVVFVAFDVLYAGGTTTMEQPLHERRQVLEDLVKRDQPLTKVGSRSSLGQQGELLFEAPSAEDSFARLILAPAVQLESVDQLEQAYVEARARGNEGVMLKARQSLYQPGRRGLAWLKLKRELATLDVVVTAAEYGHGKRAGWLSDYTFAVRDGDVLRNIGKAYSGVTDAEIARLTQFFLEHTLEDYGYIRSVEPLMVLEVAFNNVMRSDRHDSGFALRFPRILRIREDKPVSEIDTLERVAEIYHSQPDKPVETAQDSGSS
jgi:DNA ligase-1